MARHHHPFSDTVTALATRVGVCRAHLSTILATNKCKNPDLAKRIERETGGVVKAAVLLGLEPLKTDHGSTPDGDDLGSVGAA